MKLYFVCEGRFIKKGKNIYCSSGGFTKKIWQRYLQTFGSVIVIARVQKSETATINESWLSSGPQIQFIELPYYIGPMQFLKSRKKVIKLISQHINSHSAYICRIPGQIGSITASILRKKGIAYGVEVVGDAWDAFAASAIQHPLRRIFRICMFWEQKKVVRNSFSALYVTKDKLQKRYPNHKNDLQFSASNVEINVNNLPSKPRKWEEKDTYNLLCIGSLEQTYKAPDIAIMTLVILQNSDLNVHITWLGGGKYMPKMQELARGLGVEEMITFAGNVSGQEVQEQLKKADIFVHFSRSEGLARAIIEAMASGLPCIGTEAGGTPELIDNKYIIPINNAYIAAQKITKLATTEDQYNAQSIRNFNTAKQYYPQVLDASRQEFYRSLLRTKKICFVVCSPTTATTFLANHIAALSAKYSITLVANISNINELKNLEIDHYKDIKILRKVSIFNDLKSLKNLYLFLKKEHFNAVHSLTPKAGFLTALASFLVPISYRIHTFTGQVWATRRGLSRKILMSLDRIIARLDNHILVDSSAQRSYLVEQKIINSNARVLAGGSISGVDITRFSPSPIARQKIRISLGIDDSKIVYAYLGRLNKDKGIFELLSAFNHLTHSKPNTYLLIIGTDEEHCMSKLHRYEHIIDGINFKFYGSTDTPELLLQATDIFCLPSHREGFGTSVIEASCLGLPVICSDIYGLQDAMEEGITGLRVKAKDEKSLLLAMQTLYNDPQLRERLASAGRRRVLSRFSGEKVTQAWVEFYDSILGQ